MRDRRLLRELATLVALKLVLISLLWWGFVRDARIEVTPASAAAAMAGGSQHDIRGATKHGQ
ncbi:cytochrome oxidase putative small subunit CydP [Niveibacterium sp.]|uniref:cytochrome oxidase putative small subunit CydP n=1 Tax=Niveibacterium sp. TaxID=2017444 RepID=UPI0035B34A00